MRIVEVDKGIANRIDDLGVIEVHKNLKNYPGFYEYVIDHELGHESGAFSFKDLLHDLKAAFAITRERIAFMLETPSSFYQLLPYIKRNKVIYWDLNLLIIYVFLSLLIIGGFVIWK